MCTNIQKSVESANKRVKMLCFLLLFSLSFANAVADTAASLFPILRFSPADALV